MKPILNESLALEDYREFYWLKTELVDFCRASGLSTGGSKKDIAARIDHYLMTGEKLSASKDQGFSPVDSKVPITLNTKLKVTYKNDMANRLFFMSIIGERFKFNVVFMKWVKLNLEKDYQDAVDEWLKIEADKKAGVSYKISSQFEFNQYIRDFFTANPNKSRTDAIICWKYKTGIRGNNRYEGSDLKVLDTNSMM